MNEANVIPMQTSRANSASRIGSVELGCFRLEEVIGRGSYGITYRAEQLGFDRDVVVKIAHADLLDSRDGELVRRRFEDELRAATRVEHPNLVTLYTAGETSDGLPAIAMELVTGDVLEDLLLAYPGGLPATLLVPAFTQLASALAALHAADVVHRDLSPRNIMFDTSSERLPRLKVLDFGVARLRGRPRHTVGAVGTPRYMAPEQLYGEVADARADQFAFAVSLYEALYDGHPYGGDSMSGLLLAMEDGRPTVPVTPPAGTARLWPILERCLRIEREHRYPSMADVLARLRDAVERPRRRRRRAVLLAIGAVGLGGGAALASIDSPRPCESIERRLDGVWDDARAQQVTETLARHDPTGDGALGVERIVGHLDEYSRDWLGAAQRTCEATHVEGLQSAALLDLRSRCLEDDLVRLSALVDLLVSASTLDELERAPQAIGALPEPQRCVRLSPRAVADEEGAETEAVARRIAGLYASLDLGRDTEVLELGPALLEEVSTDEGRARVELLMGRALAMLDRTDEAEARFAEASRFAVAAGASLQIVDARMRRAQIEYERGRYREAWTLLEVATEDAMRLDSAGVRVQLAATRARLHEVEARYDAALEELGRAEEAALRSRNALMQAQIRVQRAQVLASLARNAEAIADGEAALAIYVEHLGDAHPNTALQRHNLGAILVAAGEHERAREQFVQELAVLERVRGPSGPGTDRARADLSVVELELGRIDEAIEHAERAVGATADPKLRTAPRHSIARVVLAHALGLRGRHQEARRWIEEELRVVEASVGASHPQLVMPLLTRGEVELRAGEPQAALESLSRAARLGSADDTARPYVLGGIGRAQLALGRPEARGTLERAVELGRGLGTDEPDLAELVFALARAVDADTERARAVELAREAERLASAPRAAELQGQIHEWIATHEAAPAEGGSGSSPPAP